VVAVIVSSIALVALVALAVYVVGLTRRVVRAHDERPQSSAVAALAPPTPSASTPPAEPPAASASASTKVDPPIPTVPTKHLVGATAMAALDALSARLDTCVRPGGYTGRGAAWVTFGRNGSVSLVKLGPPLAGTPEGKCVGDLFRGARVAPFLGPPGGLIYKFTLPPRQGESDGSP
jgi:hypothetical protein